MKCSPVWFFVRSVEIRRDLVEIWPDLFEISLDLFEIHRDLVEISPDLFEIGPDLVEICQELFKFGLISLRSAKISSKSDPEKEPLTLDGFKIERPVFERREQEVEKILMDFAPYGNNNVVAMMRRMNYLPRMNLRRTVKKPTIQVSIIPTATPPLRLGYKPTDDDLLEMEMRKMARVKAKAKGLPCPPEPLKPYTSTLNRKFVEAREKEEEYQEACQHALKSPYELRSNDKDEEGGAAPSNDEDGSDDKSDSSSVSNSSNSGHDDDDNSTDSESNNSKDYDSSYNGNDWGEPPSDREDEDAYLFYEEYDDDVDYYDEDIEDDVEVNRWSDTDSDQYRLINVLENAKEENQQANQMFGPRYDKHGREIPELGSYYDSEPSSPTPHTEEEDDIDVRLAVLDQKLMVHSLRIMTLKDDRGNNERMEGGESEHLPQHTYLGSRGKHNLFDEWMDSTECLDAFVTDKPTYMEVDEEATDYMDEDPIVLMLREEGT
ncbi:hypothetical protein SO802_017847 [Lithocarpus litseifolius]|uniref:Uncharacterized protein n=1 Tax=Lithocarpus litseifolius TaxID=425828 RepID=A0AAW2CJ54_9ROSI